MVTIKVEQRHIDNGVKCNSLECPIARACTETLGYVCSVGTVKVWDVSRDKDYDMPLTAVNARLDFDKGLGMKPFEFNLDIKHDVLVKDRYTSGTGEVEEITFKEEQS